MGARLGDLDQRDIARLRTELAEELAARFAYPPFFDFPTGTLRVRPVGRAKRQEIADFVQTINFTPLDQTEVSSAEVRRFFEKLFLRYLEVNREVGRPAARRRLPGLRADAPRAAADVQRGLVALAAGAPGSFGVARPVPSWSPTTTRGPRREARWEQVERSAQLLQAALTHQGDESPPAASPSRGQTPAWPSAPVDAPVPLGAPGGSTHRSPFAGLETGSQSPVFVRPDLSDLPTGLQAALGWDNTTTGAHAAPAAAPRELPPDLLQLYSEYLRDSTPATVPMPATAAPTAPLAPGAAPGGPARWGAPAAGSWATPQPSRAPSAQDMKTDQMIFLQLRHQLDAYVRLAARSYGVRALSTDPAAALDALRRSGSVDEADLRMAEGILALSDRIVEGGAATLDDYRQALMLYLLYHRNRMGT